ncbi:MAG: EcsC family protein [Methyloprofundus sp.]|nr:EcsC family protein [Methyloprofundus sp.]
MEQADLDALKKSATRLESTNIATKISHFVGLPIEKTLDALPGHWSTVVTKVTKTALTKALDSALFTLKANHRPSSSNNIHKFLAGLSGALGGSFGIATLAIELPVSATIMLRSIADIARSEGEQLEAIETKIACLEVFALSGGPSSTETADTSYYAVRSFLTKSLGDTTKHLAAKGLAKEGAPALVKLVNAVASRFSIPVSEKIIAQSIPAIGAVGGASINLLFIDHFQEMAKAHFTIRRLERAYGQDKIKQIYTDIVRKNADQKGKANNLNT